MRNFKRIYKEEDGTYTLNGKIVEDGEFLLTRFPDGHVETFKVNNGFICIDYHGFSINTFIHTFWLEFKRD